MAYDQSPIPQGYGSLPIQPPSNEPGRYGLAPRTNPYLDEIDQAAGNAHASLSPGAQEALKRAGAPVGIQSPQQPQGITGPRPAAPSLAPPMSENMPNGQPAMMAATTGITNPHGDAYTPPPQARAPIQAVPQSEQEGRQISELNRITAPDTGFHNRQNTGVSGREQIHNPWARIPLGILEALGTGFAPGLTSAIPGTQLHHNMLVNQAEGGIAEQEKIRKAQEEADTAAATQQHLGAESTELESRPELREAQNELKSRGLDINQARNEAQQQQKQSELEQKIRASGYDPKTGEPLPYEQLSEQQQAVHDWRAAQAEERQATALLRRAQAENQPEMLRLAQQRLLSAQNNRSTAERRLELSREQFEFRSQGTINGVAPEGTLLSESGKPVGTANALNVRPTGTERNRGDLAASAHEQLRDMRDIVNRHPEFFGPGAGRAQEFQNWIGSEDPDAKRFATARTILAEHGSGVFGARSAAAASAQKIASGEWKDNPAAIQGALDQIEKAMTTIGGRGTPRTVGGNVTTRETAPATTIHYREGNTDYDIPPDKVKRFEELHPGAKKQ